MSLSIDDDVQEPDLAAIVRIIMLVISVIFGLLRAKLEDLLKGRPEHMELLQNVYRELSVAAVISMFLSLIESSSATTDLAHLFGMHDGEQLNDSLHSLHILFLMGIMLYMGMCTTIMGTLKIVNSILKRWDSQTIVSGVNEMQTMLESIPVDVAFPVLKVMFRSLQISYTRRKLAWLMYREVFFMQFVSDSEESPSDFSYVRYLRLAIYEVCLQLTEIRLTAGVIIVLMILARWARVRFLDLNSDIGFYTAVAWEILSFVYVYHVNSRIMKMCHEYLIDSRKFTRKSLQDFQERVERFGLHEVQQAHDTDAPKIVVDTDQDPAAKPVNPKHERMSQNVLDAWAQHKALRERRREELVKMAAAKFTQLAVKRGFRSRQVAPDDDGTTIRSEDFFTRQSGPITNRKASLGSVEEHGLLLNDQLGRSGYSFAEFRKVSLRIAARLSVLRRRVGRQYLAKLTPQQWYSSKTAPESDEKKSGENMGGEEQRSVEVYSSHDSRTAHLNRNQQQQSVPASEGPRTSLTLSPNQQLIGDAERLSSDTATARRLHQSLSTSSPRQGSLPDQRLTPRRSFDGLSHLPVQSAADEAGPVSLPSQAFGSDSVPRRGSQPTMSHSAGSEMGHQGSQPQLPGSTPRRLSLSLSAANPANHSRSSARNEKGLTQRRMSLTSDHENSVSYSGSRREDSPSMNDPHSNMDSRTDSPSRRGSAHQDGHHGFRQSVRKSLKKPVEEIVKKRELDRRRSTSLREHFRQASESELQQSKGAAHKRHLYTYRLIASFGGAKLEQAQADDLENSFRWWASPGAEGLLTIMHSVVLIDTLMFGLTVFLIATGGSLALGTVLIPLVLKIICAPFLIQNYTMITSSGSMARIELLLLAIHQKLEEEAMAKISRADQTRMSTNHLL